MDDIAWVNGTIMIASMAAPIWLGWRAGRVVQGVAAVITIMLLLVFLTSQIKAVGILAAGWPDLPESWGAAQMISIIILYTVLGGLTPVAWTDTLMLMGMVLAAVLICGQNFGDLGPAEPVAALREADPGLVDPETSAPDGQAKSAVYLVLPYAFMFSAVLPYMAVRFLA